MPVTRYDLKHFHSTQSYPLENPNTEGECNYYKKAVNQLKDLIQGDINPADLLKLKVTMCSMPDDKKGKDKWAVEHIQLPQEECSGSCFSDDDESQTTR